MSRYLKLIFLLFALSFISCSQSDENENEQSRVDIEISDQSYPIMDHLTDFELLVFPSEPFIGRIDKVIQDNDLYYVVDNMIKDIKVYDLEMNHVRTIAHQGDGPGEYQSIYNAFVRGENLYIFSHFDFSIFRYDLQGQFIEQIKLDDRPQKMIQLAESFVGFNNYNSSNSSRDNLVLWNANGEREKAAFSYTEDMKFMIGYSGGLMDIPGDETQFYYHQPLSNTLNRLNTDLEITKQYNLDIIDDSYTGSVESFPVNSLRYGYIQHFLRSFDQKMFVVYRPAEPPVMKFGLIELDKNIFHPTEKISPHNMVYLISRFQFQDERGFVYSLPTFDFITSLARDFENAFDGFPEQIRKPIMENAENENFKYLIKFKFKKD